MPRSIARRTGPSAGRSSGHRCDDDEFREFVSDHGRPKGLAHVAFTANVPMASNVAMPVDFDGET
jgi:hypothetical protein